jgi:hypothetical protein
MSESNPVYSTNPALNALEHIGHEAHVIEQAIVSPIATAVHKIIQIKAELQSQYPTLKSEVLTLIAAGEALAPFGATLTAIVASKGLNIPLDEAALAQLPALAGAVQKFLADLATLSGTVFADVKTDLAS